MPCQCVPHYSHFRKCSWLFSTFFLMEFNLVENWQWNSGQCDWKTWYVYSIHNINSESQFIFLSNKQRESKAGEACCLKKMHILKYPLMHVEVQCAYVSLCVCIQHVYVYSWLPIWESSHNPWHMCGSKKQEWVLPFPYCLRYNL